MTEKMKNLKEGMFKKIEYEKNNNCISRNVIVLKIDDLSLHLYDEYGEELHIIWKDIKKICITRSLSIEQKEVMKAYYKSYKALIDSQKIFEKNRDNHSKLFINSKSELMKIKGILTPSQFGQYFLDLLPNDIKEIMKRNEYRIEVDDNTRFGGKVYLSISRDVMIGKWLAKNLTFVYEEYDGSLFLTTDCEKNSQYKKYLREYRHLLPLNMKNVKQEEYLDVGDKGSLYYICHYSIELKNALTTEYAKEIVKKTTC